MKEGQHVHNKISIFSVKQIEIRRIFERTANSDIAPENRFQQSLVVDCGEGKVTVLTLYSDSINSLFPDDSSRERDWGVYRLGKYKDEVELPVDSRIKAARKSVELADKAKAVVRNIASKCKYCDN